MANYPPNSVYLCELARTSTGNPITVQHSMLLLGLVVDPVTGEIFDAEMNAICGLTSRFVRGLLEGRSLRTDLEILSGEIKGRYHGASTGGLISALRACAKKLEELYPAAR